MGAGIDECLRQIRRVGRSARAPGASMDKDVHRRVRLACRINVNLLDLCRTVGKPAWRPKAGKRRGALLRVALGDFGLIGRPQRLSVGSVDLVLVVVEEDQRPLRLLALCPAACAFAFAGPPPAEAPRPRRLRGCRRGTPAAPFVCRSADQCCSNVPLSCRAHNLACPSNE